MLLSHLVSDRPVLASASIASRAAVVHAGPRAVATMAAIEPGAGVLASLPAVVAGNAAAVARPARVLVPIQPSRRR